MPNTRQIISSSIVQALSELRANKLRTALSLLGIAIGIFCIVAVLTVLNSMEAQIHESMASLGSDVLYVNRKPWMEEEDGQYKWWEYLQRRPVSLSQFRQVEQTVPGIDVATLCFRRDNIKLKATDQELEGVALYGVTPGFDKVQNVELLKGRYLTLNELDAGSNSAVIGHEVKENLFAGRDAIGHTIQFGGRAFHIVGVMKKEGRNMAGFDFDEAVIISYMTAGSIYDLQSMDWNNDPVMMIRANTGVPVDELRDELRGALRTMRKVRPGAKDDFSINQLSKVSERLGVLFGTINMIGAVIGGFSLLVGAFGIANIMFVTVRERTKVIGLKKAIGAHRRVILTEFLIEAITLCLIGGGIGIILVFLLGLGLTHGADFPVSMSMDNVVFGVGISALVGIIAGIIPAYRASRLDPVVAIRET